MIRTLMLEAAEPAKISPTQISFTATIRLMDDNLIPLGQVLAPRRQHIVESTRKRDRRATLATASRTYSSSALVKRARSRYERKKPEHTSAPALELDASFHEIIAVVPCIPPKLSNVPEMPLLSLAKEAADLASGGKTRCSDTLESSACKPTPCLPNPSSPSALVNVSSSPDKLTKAGECTGKTGLICTTRSP